MNLLDLALDQLREAPWNPNQMDQRMLARLRESIGRFGLVENLVVRPLPEGGYEVLSGNQRLKVLCEAGFSHAPCLVVDLDDARARLLAQALNRIQGEDDLGLRAELMRQVLKTIPEAQVLTILPETADSLKAMASLGRESIAQALEKFQQAQSSRLHHYAFQVTSGQLAVVDQAFARLLPEARKEKGDSPNLRGTALYLLCKWYLGRKAGDE